MPSPSPSVKIQIFSGKGYLLGNVDKLYDFKSLLTMLSIVLPLHLKQTFPPIIWIFTEGEGDGMESRHLLKSFLLYDKILIANLKNILNPMCSGKVSSF